MILGKDRHVHAACFDELEGVLQANGVSERVLLNAHAVPGLAPVGLAVYNLENIGIQLPADAFYDREIWDISRRNVEALSSRRTELIAAEIPSVSPVVRYVPVGYHISMERFAMRLSSQRDIDIVFTGTMNARRHAVLSALQGHGLRVLQMPHTLYGAERDDILARSRLSLNIRFYDTAFHPVLRTAHCTANHLPVLSEHAPEAPTWALLQAGYSDLVDRARELLDRRREYLDHVAEAAYLAFRMCPFVIPSEWK